MLGWTHARGICGSVRILGEEKGSVFAKCPIISFLLAVLLAVVFGVNGSLALLVVT